VILRTGSLVIIRSVLLALEDFLTNPVPVKQLLIEFHHHFRGIGIARTEQIVRRLQALGYKIFHISQRGLEMSLVHDV
jgi:hypothetical protein